MGFGLKLKKTQTNKAWILIHQAIIVTRTWLIISWLQNKWQINSSDSFFHIVSSFKSRIQETKFCPGMLNCLIKVTWGTPAQEPWAGWQESAVNHGHLCPQQVYGFLWGGTKKCTKTRKDLTACNKSSPHPVTRYKAGASMCHENLWIMHGRLINTCDNRTSCRLQVAERTPCGWAARGDHVWPCTGRRLMYHETHPHTVHTRFPVN